MEVGAAAFVGPPGGGIGGVGRWSGEEVEIAAPLPLSTPLGTAAGGGVFLVKVKPPPVVAAAACCTAPRAAIAA
jgi:hypothetical protein